MTRVLDLALLFASGVIAGVVNVVAGGGSFLTLPALMALGLSPVVANATNRVAIVIQTFIGSVEFWRAGRANHRLVWRLAPASILGAALGAWLASGLDAARFERMFGALLIGMSIALFTKERWFTTRPRQRRVASLWVQLAFLGIGIYGGFIQAGVGLFLITGAVLLVGTDVITANALKLQLVFVFTVPALVIFALKGQVVWLPGLTLSAGNALGAWLGVRMALRVSPRWLFGGVALAALATGLVLIWP